VDRSPAPLIAPRRRCRPVCVHTSLQVQPRWQSATAHGDSSAIARTARQIALDAARRTRVGHRKRLRRGRIRIDGLLLREIDVAVKVGRNRDEPAHEGDSQFARIVAGVGGGRRSEEKTRRQHRCRGDRRPFQHGITLLRAPRIDRDCILDRSDAAAVEPPRLGHTDALVQIP
jgi:hypothetical protein